MLQKRLQWLDIAKALAIILMVVGHTSIPVPISNFIWSFHMPLFFIASGWTTNWEKYGLMDFAKGKTRTLLLPFAIYSIIVLVIQILQGWNTVGQFVQNGWIAYALWFIPVLYLSLLCSKCLYCLNKRQLRYVAVSVILAIGYLLSFYHVQLPWTLSSVPYATCLIYLGSELKRIPTRLLYPRWYVVLSLFALTVVISQFFRLDMCFNNIIPVLPLTIGAISGTCMVFMFSMLIEKYSKVLIHALVAVGKETYIIVAFSQITIMLLNKYFQLNVVIKYALLVCVLVVLKYAKDGMNKLFKTKIL